MAARVTPLQQRTRLTSHPEEWRSQKGRSGGQRRPHAEQQWPPSCWKPPTRPPSTRTRRPGTSRARDKRRVHAARTARGSTTAFSPGLARSASPRRYSGSFPCRMSPVHHDVGPLCPCAWLHICIETIWHRSKSRARA